MTTTVGEAGPRYNNNRGKYNNNAKPRPTHFLSLRIDQPHIVEGVQQLQDNIINKYPQLKQYLTPAIKSHLTLFVLNCPTPESIEKAKQTLISCQDVINKHYSDGPCSAVLSGLSHFNDKVVYLDVAESSEKKKLQEFVYDMHTPFKDAGLMCEDMKPMSWTPHSTIMKLSKGNNKYPKRGKYDKNENKDNSSSTPTTKPVNYPPVYKIDRAAYADQKEMKFGEQTFVCIELSAMSGVDPDGYYRCLHRQPFTSVSPSSSSSSSYSGTTTSTN